MFEFLPLDVLIEIAQYDETAWYNLYRVDDRFHEYSRTHNAIAQFIKLATERKIEYTYGVSKLEVRIFGRLHSFDDEPAITYIKSQSKYWYYNGLRHRIGGPAYSTTNGRLEWWEYNAFICGE